MLDADVVAVSPGSVYLCAILDGYSRFIVHWEIGDRMYEPDIEIIRRHAHQGVGEAQSRIIFDNSPQFDAKGFYVHDGRGTGLV